MTTREEAAAKALEGLLKEAGLEYVSLSLFDVAENMRTVLKAADAVMLDDATVGRASKVLMNSLSGPYMTNEQIARAVLAAAVGEER